ncbi:hypothetical protein J1605_013815 [Eschrichtius robustus]|uniref:Small integral membrane protein 19 n=1 Tax=Eschrichtius robustus TaxID=9764 RepID=A0AB34GFZ2_ESCRO|nr:hypothetical protein J1605_013815 [Eschrichtius robustus]
MTRKPSCAVSKGKDLAPRSIRKPPGRQEMTKQRSSGPCGNRLRASGRDCGGKSTERSSRAACLLQSERRLTSLGRAGSAHVSESSVRLASLGGFGRVVYPAPHPASSASPMPGGYGVMGDEGSIDYSVHEAWNEATNVYLVVILVSFGLFMYAKRNKRKIMRIFSVPPPTDTLSEPNFYDTISKIRLRQQLEMYSI